ncbi:response regulator transcription factor [Leucothrix arctica]|uniref:DNA-binding response regulator n=1 Tax=Leucothrix arctica TaxID=1481894 RepID=A0A317C6H6_9GAMM|nr:response regulator [Leucothrix arctica]PWQ93801.1 DNA-binding response regulator [Leucothrix arctica]
MSNEDLMVYIVDDDESVRDSLTDLMDSVGLKNESFASCQDFLTRYEPGQQGCLLLDIRMPMMSGLELQEELNKRNTSLAIIFITGHGDITMAVKAMSDGAQDFVQKPFRDQDLLDRINHTLGKCSKGYELQQERQIIQQHLLELTSRESEVMRMVIDGKANKVIAIDLGLSQRTVEAHRAKVMDKLGARSLADLVRIVIHSDLA